MCGLQSTRHDIDNPGAFRFPSLNYKTTYNDDNTLPTTSIFVQYKHTSTPEIHKNCDTNRIVLLPAGLSFTYSFLERDREIIDESSTDSKTEFGYT